MLVGDAEEYGTLLQMMLNRIELPESPEFLILPSSDGRPSRRLGADALPDTAQICSCNNVGKGPDLRSRRRWRHQHRRARRPAPGRHGVRRLRARWSRRS